MQGPSHESDSKFYCPKCVRFQFLKVLWPFKGTPVAYTLQKRADLSCQCPPKYFEWSYFSVGQIEKKLQFFIPGPKQAKMRDSHAKCVSLGLRVVVLDGVLTI